MTLRELAAVSFARMEYEWTHTSSLLCLLANCHRDPDEPPFRPRDFNPMLPPRKKPTITVREMKAFFPKT